MQKTSIRPASLPRGEHISPPNWALLALEFRAPWEFSTVLPAWPVLQRAPRGDGHAVVVFPGLSASDASTAPLRKYLSGLGYLPYGWDQGFNFGPRAGVLEAAKSQVRHLFAQTGQPVSLVGWSLGGVYAREIAKALPDMARCVISLGTPFAGGPKSTNAWRIYELTSGRAAAREAENYELNSPPLCPTTSIYSRTDGIVAWQASVQDNDARNTQLENIEVVASHVGLGLNPSTWWAVADRLSQPHGDWNPFKRPSMLGLQALVYPNPLRN
jgi:pimeloyl-ACP methyl ester carboxylesterase